MFTSGGVSGYGRGGFALDSKRLLSSVPPCEKWLALESAVANARPQHWQPRYESKDFLTDQMQYVLSLTIDGKRYDTTWTSAAEKDVLPSDVEALSAAIWAARDAPCRP